MRRAKLYYLRTRSGKAARIKGKKIGAQAVTPAVKAQTLEYVEAFVTAAILAAVIIIFIGQNFWSRAARWNQISTIESVSLWKDRYRFREPQKGEVVVFIPRSPKAQVHQKGRWGVPGDEIKIRILKFTLTGYN